MRGLVISLPKTERSKFGPDWSLGIPETLPPYWATRSLHPARIFSHLHSHSYASLQRDRAQRQVRKPPAHSTISSASEKLLQHQFVGFEKRPVGHPWSITRVCAPGGEKIGVALRPGEQGEDLHGPRPFSFNMAF